MIVNVNGFVVEGNPQEIHELIQKVGGKTPIPKYEIQVHCHNKYFDANQLAKDLCKRNVRLGV